MKTFKFKVEEKFAGQRLDKFVVSQCSEFSRSYIQKLIEKGNVLVNSEPKKSGYKIEAGDRIKAEISCIEKEEIKPPIIKLDIIYEDKDVLILHKPAGVVTSPPHLGYKKDTIAGALLAYSDVFKKVERFGIVHRLDKDTSGLIVVAKNNKARQNLISQFKGRKIKKSYIVLVYGHLKPEQGIIEAPIVRSKKDKTKMSIAPEDEGKPAVTFFKITRYLAGEKYQGDFSLVEVTPKTGRTHQIRVHFACLGHPVVGDTIYGPKKQKLKITRQFLHANYLKFRLPSTKKWVEFECKLPQDLQKVLEGLKG